MCPFYSNTKIENDYNLSFYKKNISVYLCLRLNDLTERRRVPQLATLVRLQLDVYGLIERIEKVQLSNALGFDAHVAKVEHRRTNDYFVDLSGRQLQIDLVLVAYIYLRGFFAACRLLQEFLLLLRQLFGRD
jgi:hypothetical protein